MAVATRQPTNSCTPRRYLGASTAAALYGPTGFYRRAGPGPTAHFRTSVHASPLYAAALCRLLGAIDEALGHPDPLDVVDVGAGRGELLLGLWAALGERRGEHSEPHGRVRLAGVELAPRPVDLPVEID